MLLQPKKEKLLILHIEGGEPSLIEKWCEQGKLPNLDKLMKKGVYCRLSTPGYVSSSSALVSFATGTNPGKHGMVLSHRHLKSGTYQTIKKYATDLKEKDFWTVLSGYGEKVLALDMPYSYPTANFKETLICSWGDENPLHPPASIPSQLIHEVLAKFGEHKLQGWYHHKLATKEEWKQFSDVLVNANYQRSKIIKYLCQNTEWDCAAFNFGEVHWAGHMAWHLHDTRHPEYDASIAEYCGDIMLNCYQALDSVIGELLTEIPHSNLIVTSALGMGTQVAGEMMLNEVLQKLGMTPTPAKQQQKKWSLRSLKNKLLPGSKGISYTIQKIEKIIHPKWLMFVRDRVPKKFWDKWTRRFLDLGNIRGESLAFQVPGDHSGLIRINLKGREPKGKIGLGKEYDDLCNDLIEALLELRDSNTGEAVVKEVIKLKDRFSGELIDEIPDLAVVWREGLPIEAIESPKVGKIVLKEYHRRSGGHLYDGFFIGCGTDFKQNEQIPKANSMDIAPTVFSLFGHNAPENMDGKVMKDAFRNT
ncbi:MAG: alkaline phosphatase family protein [Chitinophagales bacterium]